MTPPTRVRYQVLVLACLLAALTYLDRACFGMAGTTIVAELGETSEADLRWAHLAFAVAYGLFEIPAGWWGDRFGPRRVLIRIVLWWSFFTALTGLVGWRVAGVTFGGWVFLTVVRFLFGAGEAGAFPNIARTAYTAPVISWRGAFVLFGGLGILWCLAFAWRFRNRPDEHPDVNPAERE